MTKLLEIPKYTRVLSIDGGGIRGIIPGQILANLERILQERTKNPEARLADAFDLIAGTSTGGILTCAYLCPDLKKRPRFTASQAVDLYTEWGDEIFDIPIWHKIRSAGGLTDEKYPAEKLEGVLREYFGDLWLSDLLGPCLITAYDIKYRRARFFTQHDAKEVGRDYLVRDIARATSAAPTYFEASLIKSKSHVPHALVDGGVFANNPALCAYAEVTTKIRPKSVPSEMVILSLGTGKGTDAFHHGEAKDWGLVGWARPIIDIMMTGVAETVDYQLKQLFDAFGHGNHYVRLDADLSREPAEAKCLDNASRDNLARLRDIGQKVAEDNDKQLQAFADLLLAEHDGHG